MSSSATASPCRFDFEITKANELDHLIGHAARLGLAGHLELLRAPCGRGRSR